jgi:hypothetical protein
MTAYWCEDEQGWPTYYTRLQNAFPTRGLQPVVDFDALRVAAIWSDAKRIFVTREDGPRYRSDDGGVRFTEFIGPVAKAMDYLYL